MELEEYLQNLHERGLLDRKKGTRSRVGEIKIGQVPVKSESELEKYLQNLHERGLLDRNYRPQLGKII